VISATISRKLALLLALAPVWASAADSKKADREALKKALVEVIKRSPLASARISVQVQSLEDGAIILTQSSEELLNPASNVKLFTAATALATLGSDYHFDTEFLTESSLEKGKTDILYVRGKGDPTVTTERLYAMVGELYHAGLREVGDIHLDDSWFDKERLAPGFDQEVSDRAYMAPTGALSLNWNTIAVYVRATDRAGTRAVVELEPPSDFFQIHQSLRMGGRFARRFSVRSEAAGEKQMIRVTGTVPSERSASAIWKKIDNPPFYFGYTLKRMLADRGIKVRGRVRLGSVPPNAKILYVAQSETLDFILKRLNKVSSNFVAEQLIKTLGAEANGSPGSFANGVRAVEFFLERQIGIPRGTYVMRNGSGLNDTNRFSSAQIVKLLRAMYERFPLSPEYLSSLGIAGKDGTVRYRFEGSDAVGRLRAKTGTLEKVSALSGYVQSVGGERFCFAMIVNDFTGRAGLVMQGLDALGVAIAASGSAQGPHKAAVALYSPESVVQPIEEMKTRIRTYLTLGKQGDKRNIPFLRTAWRAEKDPAMRAVVAESLYQSNPEDYLGVRALLDSFVSTDAVYGRLRQVAKELGIGVPGLTSVAELAAQGNAEALSRLIELCGASPNEEAAQQEVSTAMSDVARSVPLELLGALRTAGPAESAIALDRLAKGLSSQESDHPFLPEVRKIGAGTSDLAAFAREFETALGDKLAEERAPRGAPASPPASSQGAPKPAPTAIRPGG
jgi:D-alanyl-D-alanine carboxypeptidase/D-alanyl-D-alanine-endopeptidase (penicillin-binding protein 4)